MRKSASVLSVLLLIAAFAATAFAQSSGNFTAGYDTTQCAITASDGTLTGGISGRSLPDRVRDANITSSASIFSATV